MLAQRWEPNGQFELNQPLLSHLQQVRPRIEDEYAALGRGHLGSYLVPLLGNLQQVRPRGEGRDARLPVPQLRHLQQVDRARGAPALRVTHLKGVSQACAAVMAPTGQTTPVGDRFKQGPVPPTPPRACTVRKPGKAVQLPLSQRQCPAAGRLTMGPQKLAVRCGIPPAKHAILKEVLTQSHYSALAAPRSSISFRGTILRWQTDSCHMHTGDAVQSSAVQPQSSQKQGPAAERWLSRLSQVPGCSGWPPLPAAAPAELPHREGRQQAKAAPESGHQPDPPVQPPYRRGKLKLSWLPTC